MFCIDIVDAYQQLLSKFSAYMRFYCFRFHFRWIGAIFDKDDVFGLNVFDLAITRQNVFNSKLRLVPLIKRIPSMDAAKVEKAGSVQQKLKHMTFFH